MCGKRGKGAEREREKKTEKNACMGEREAKVWKERRQEGREEGGGRGE
jgi:hypothetical protein